MQEYSVIVCDKCKIWIQNDKLHRMDGPAIESSNGSKFWYIDGVEYTEDEFNNLKFAV